ncbi:hypothetical protein PHOBOS_157 [Erwinia phage vB_EamM_Phobos]|uniref:hypothetical protein n=1 Tax=Erwinia phage vB_EamM_Phobos TaxID=1883377 RepID=UPI00081CB504|nr:hypothetical protein BIZ79_gp157 [Erwinia phage vB_EamM_Phobos]ANZ50347.1 hypothetical protein PHOBOS_157 [Erwinia phage vB_EamM_Phobos]
MTKKTEVEQLLDLYNAKNPDLPQAVTQYDISLVTSSGNIPVGFNSAAQMTAHQNNDHFTGSVHLYYNKIPAPTIPNVDIACDLSTVSEYMIRNKMRALWADTFGDVYASNTTGSSNSTDIGPVYGWTEQASGPCQIVIGETYKYIGDVFRHAAVFTINFSDGTDDWKVKLDEHFAKLTQTKLDLSSANGEMDGFVV